MRLTERQLRRVIREELIINEGWWDDLKAGGQKVADTVSGFFSGKKTIRPTTPEKAQAELEDAASKYLASYLDDMLKGKEFEDEGEGLTVVKGSVQDAADAMDVILDKVVRGLADVIAVGPKP